MQHLDQIFPLSPETRISRCKGIVEIIPITNSPWVKLERKRCVFPSCLDALECRARDSQAVEVKTPLASVRLAPSSELAQAEKLSKRERRSLHHDPAEVAAATASSHQTCRLRRW